MGEIKINLTNFITIGLIAYASVWLLNKGIDAAGYGQYKA